MKANTTIAILMATACLLGWSHPQYALQHLGVTDGLSNDYVRGIAQDGSGNIWIATEMGLNRFDGYGFDQFHSRPITQEGLAAEGLNALLYDPKEDKLWIGGKYGGIDVMDCATRKIKHIGQDEGIAHVNCFSHSRDSLGIWIIPYYGKLFYYDKDTKDFMQYDVVIEDGHENSRWCAADDGQGRAYVGYVRNGLGVLNLKTGEIMSLRHDKDNPRSLPSDEVNAICIDHYDNVWVGTSDGLALYNPKTDTFAVFRHDDGNEGSLVANRVQDIQEMKDGSLWIATDGGISVLDLHSLAFNTPDSIRFSAIEACGNPYGLSSSNINSLMQDRAGNIWIGSYNKGLDIVTHIRPAFYTLPYYDQKQFSLQYNETWGLHYDAENNAVWVGGDGEVAKFDDQGELLRRYQLPQQLANSSVLAIEPDGTDHLLLGLYAHGLWRLDKRTGDAARVSGPLGNARVLSSIASDSCCWVGIGNDVYQYRNGILVPYLNDGLPKDRAISGIQRDRQGKLWVAARGRGVYVLNRDGSLHLKLDAEHGFDNNEVNGLMIDHRGGMWIGTRVGLIHVPDTDMPDKWVSLSYDQGLEDTYIRSLGEDAEGNVWITNNNHIAKWNAADSVFQVYGISDGLPKGTFAENSFARSPNGVLFFGSLAGVCYFDPSQMQETEPVAPVVISDCQWENRNSCRVSFTVADYAQCDRVEYAYFLQGISQRWTETRGDNSITFRDLPHGKYRLLVKARLHNQPWSDVKIASIDIDVEPPFWLTWWMKLIYAAIIVAAVWLGFRAYKSRLLLRNRLEMERQKNVDVQMLNDERLRFFTNITHELRTPLTLILGPLEDLTSDAQLPVAYQPRVKAIHDSAQRLLTLINQILEFRKTETQNRKLLLKPGLLQRLVMETGLHYKELNRNKRVQVVLDIDKTLPPMMYDPDIVATVLANFLSNAVKYTQEGEIRVSLHARDIDGQRWAQIEVADTGAGIDAKALPHIFDRYFQAKGSEKVSGTGIGLTLVKGLSEIHHAKLSVESIVGRGSTFRFAIPIEEASADYKKEENEDTVSRDAEAASHDEPVEESAPKPPLALVVEDNDDIRDYIVSSLSADYRTLAAPNGAEGLELALANIPDIIVTDVMMPVMDGIEMCQRIKADVRTSHIPVVMLTAKDTMLDKEKGYESGADSYLTKPFTAKLLTLRLANLIEQRQRMAAFVQRSMSVLPCAAEHVASEAESAPTPPKLSRIDAEFLEKFNRIVEENISNPDLDMTMMQQRMCMSHSTLYRKLKALTGISGNEFIRKLRLGYALKLLINKEANVSEAAYAAGFNDPAYFRSCFKAQYGVTPSQYIKDLERKG